jgi:NADPH2 dehydrogenase
MKGELFIMAKLFSSMVIKDVQLKNRIVMAPMCMYSADKEGYANDWHFNHYSSRAVGGAGLILLEATGVEARGRISDRDLGIWRDEHIEGLKKIVDLCRENGSRVGIQLAHAGRKSEVMSEPSIAPSAIAFSEKYRVPVEMSVEDIKAVVNSFREGALRAFKAGFDIIEIHGAHGYLINEFLSPLTNKREDEYGGNAENRARFLKEVIGAVREVWPPEKPLFVRVSAEEYDVEGNHDVAIGEMLRMAGEDTIDCVDVSSGGVTDARMKVFPGYQIRFAETIKRVMGVPVIAGGLITDPSMAEEVLQNDRADLIFLGRELLRNPYWPLQAARDLKAEVQWPAQYERARK